MLSAAPSATLNPRHPLFPYLVDIVYPQLGAYPQRPRILVHRLVDSPWVYRLTEEGSAVSVFNKGAFLPDRLKSQKRFWLEREFENLLLLRNLGFDRPPHRVPRPLGDRASLSLGLCQAWEEGRHLDFFFQQAIYHRESGPLFSRLQDLALFLARLHQKTATTQPMDWTPIESYFEKVLGQLLEEDLVSPEGLKNFHRLLARWLRRLGDAAIRQVLVHGDATPTNFLFSTAQEMVALDLERLKPGDCVWDLGMVCGEIKHAFLWRRRDGESAEPFIRYFLQRYAHFFTDPLPRFEEITRRNPFFMALTELRIARNRYLDRPYRMFLINEAEGCLASGLAGMD